MSSRPRNRKRDTPDPDSEQQRVREPETEIRLTTEDAVTQSRVRFIFKEGEYQYIEDKDHLLHLLTLPSRIISKEELALKEQLEATKAQQESADKPPKPALQPPPLPPEYPQPDPDQDIGKELEALYGNRLSSEELAKLDAQPNPFNFSDRVSQTQRIPVKELGVQTEPPPSNCFSSCVGLSIIYDAYERDYERVLAREKALEKEREKKEKEKKSQKLPPDPMKLTPPAPPPKSGYGGEDGINLNLMSEAVRLIERMINQNVFDDITHDFKYWNDCSDDFRPMEGSLLPLWKFISARSRCLIVSDVCWSPTYPDLFAASYSSNRDIGMEVGGMVCFYTLKNPGIPERLYRSPSGVTSVKFHPTQESVVVAGRCDGVVLVWDARVLTRPRILTSSTISGKHLLPVTQVLWVPTDPGQYMRFYSVSEDGRVSEWTVLPSALVHSDILIFKAISQTPCKGQLQGTATCLALSPRDRNLLLVGTDKGKVLQVSASCTRDYTTYHAHTAPVTAITFNMHHKYVFATASADWTLKLWHQNQLAALVILDLGGPISGVSWAPYSSSTLVAVTDEGRIHVYDLYLRRCRPLCVQNVLQRRRSRLACVAFNPIFPVLLVGGDKGYLLTMKLSPNLRRPHKEAKNADEQTLKEIERCKMERIIATSERAQNLS